MISNNITYYQSLTVFILFIYTVVFVLYIHVCLLHVYVVKFMIKNSIFDNWSFHCFFMVCNQQIQKMYMYIILGL